MVKGKDTILPEEQRIKVKEFRKLVADILKPDHDDQFLIRWLKARDYDLAKSEKMIRESFKFRKKIGADTILTSDYEIPEVYQKYPTTTFLGYDNEHSVVRLFTAGLCDFKGFTYSLHTIELLKLLVYFLENDLKMIRDKKKEFGELDEKTIFILDFKGFTIKQFNDKAVLNAGIQMVTMYQDNYPETLKAAYCVNVPSYFSWFFNLFKPFLNPVTLSKIKVYKTEEWKEELCRIMDPKILPAFLGGELTDPDGNPKCTQIVNWNSKVNPSYYLENRDQFENKDPDMKSVTIQQRSVLQVPVDVETKGSTLKWVFRTKENNIRFGLFFRKSDKSLEELIPVENVDCQVIPEEDTYLCVKAGTYVLNFDNSYSWLTSKQLYYKVEVETPLIIENNNQ